MPVQTRGYITRREFLAVMAVAASAAALFDPRKVFAEGETEAGKLCLISTNDVHCRIEPYPEQCTEETQQAFGYAGVGTILAEAKAKYGTSNTLLVDSGDFAQGLSTGTLTNGEALVDLMNDAGYAFATLGNHDFDYGLEQQSKLLDMAEFKPVCCNVTLTSTKKLLCDAYQVQEFEDAAGATKKVAFLGITTPSTLTSTNPAKIKDEQGNYLVSFAEDATGQALYDCIQASVDAARDEGADYVIALAHLGQTKQSDRWSSTAVVANTTGIDVMLDGHSHEKYVQTLENKAGEEVTVLQAGTQLAAAGRVVLDLATGDVEVAELVEPYVAPDETMAGYVQEVVDDLAEIKGRKIGTSEYALYAYDPDDLTTWAVRLGETNLGDLVADSYRAAMGGQIGFVNGGGVRSNMADGDVTFGDMLNVNPFSNHLALVKATGQVILDALEVGVRKYPAASGGFLQTSGLSYQIDADIESHVVLDENNNFVGVDGARRVHDVLVGGEPLDLTQTYTVASNTFVTIDGGDGFTMFKNSEVVVSEGPVDFQVLSDFVQNDLKGVIGSEYAEPAGQGRITFAVTPEPKPEPEPQPTPDPEPESDPETESKSNDSTDGKGETSSSTPSTADDSAAVVMTAGAVAMAAAAAATAAKQL